MVQEFQFWKTASSCANSVEPIGCSVELCEGPHLAVDVHGGATGYVAGSVAENLAHKQIH